MNMNTKKLICVVLCVLLLVVFMAIGISSCADESKNMPVDPTEKSEMTVPSLPEETKETVPGVMDSPFDETGESVQPTELENATTPTEDNDETKPTEKDEATEPTEKETEPTEESNITEYEKYLNMSPDEQTAFFNSFDSVEAYIIWYNNAKAEYEALHPGIDAGSGSFDFGDYNS